MLTVQRCTCACCQQAHQLYALALGAHVAVPAVWFVPQPERMIVRTMGTAYIPVVLLQQNPHLVVS